MDNVTMSDLDNVVAAYEYDYVRRGEDGASATLHRITVTPYAVNCVISDHDFSITYIWQEDTRTAYRYEMHVSGGIMERHREPLARELRLEGVSAAACNDVVSLIFDRLYPLTYCRDQIRNMEALVVIEVKLMMYDRLDDWEEEERSLRGMTPASGGALEKVRVGPEDRESSCSICLDEFPCGSEAMKTPCSHVFHGDCLLRWLENRSVCPLCRFELPTRRPQIWL